MKSEPDRLDFLIVLLPILLVGLLGFQAYEYIQMDRQRTGALPVSSEEPPATADGQEPEPPRAAPSESGDAATPPAAPPAPDAQPGGAGAGDTAAQSADTITADPGTTDSPGGDPAPAAGEPAADTDQAPVIAEPAAGANQAPDAGQPATGTSPEEAGSQLDSAQPQLLADAAAERKDPAPVPGQPVAPPEAEVLLQAQTNPAKVGELIAVDILIRDAAGVFGAIFHLRYDARMLELNEDPQSELGPFLEDPEGGTRFDARVLPSGKVVVSLNVAQGVEGRSGDGRLATFYFRALAPGETRLDLLQSALRNARGRRQPAVFTNATLLIAE